MRPKFPIVPDGAFLCETCGRICESDTWADYFCKACDKMIIACKACYPNVRSSNHIGIRHDREEHWPRFSIDLI